MAHLPAKLDTKSWLRFIVDHPWRIITLVFLVTLAFAWQIPSLRLQTSIYDLAIDNLPETLQYQNFKKEFGSEEIILVVARTHNVFDPQVFNHIGILAQQLSDVKGVRRVISLPGIKKAMDLTGKWDLSDFEKVISPVSLLLKNLLSQDKKATAISLVLEDIGDKDQVINAVERILQENRKGLTLYQIGMPLVSRALAEFTEADFLRLPPITFAVIGILLFLFFRNLRGILIPSGSVIIGLTWTFGLMAWTKTPLSMVTMIVPIFLIAVGTAYCMYIFPHYFSSIERAGSTAEASYECFMQLSFPTALAVATTIIGLGSLLVNHIHAIREFAVFSCFGILSMLILVLTFLPAVMAVLPFPRAKRVEKKSDKDLFDRVLSGIVTLNLRHQKWAFAIISILALVGLVGVTKLHVETNPVDYFKKDSQISQHFHDVYKDMAGSFPLNVVLEGRSEDYFEKPEHLKQIEQIQDFLNTVEGVDKTISFVDYLKLVNYASNQYQEQFYALPEEGFEVRMLVNNFKTMLGEDALLRFMNPQFSKANLMLRTHLSSSRDFLSAQERIENYLRKNFSQSLAFEVTGFGVVISQSSHYLAEGQVKSLFLTLMLVFGIMMLLFMSYKVGVIGMVPNVFPIIINFGLMGWMGIPLSTATSLIASVAIGLAVDDTIHYLVRYNREFKKDLDKKAALQRTIEHTGKAIIFTTLTIAAGFSVLMFSHFKPTAVFGFMMTITMFSALVGDMVLLPSLMLHVELVTIWDLLRLKLGRDPQKGIPLFEGLSRSQVHYILMAGALKTFNAGETIFRKGEVSDSMYAVISGQLNVVDSAGGTNPDAAFGAGQVINSLKTGDVFGEMGMIRSCQRSATVVATTPVEVLEINKRMIKRLQWLYPPTSQKFFLNLLTIVCNRVENLTECYLAASTVDTLSGLKTREFFLEMLAWEVARSRRYGTPLSVFVMEIDNFDGINRLYGQRAGDFILAEVGTLLSSHLRETDLLCRYDGQRFAGLLTETNNKKAREVCERFKIVLAGHSFHLDSNPVYVTSRYGLVSLDPAQQKTAQEIMADSLQALHRTKPTGQDRLSEHP